MSSWTLKTLTQRESVAQALVAAGIFADQVEIKKNLVVQSANRLLEEGIAASSEAIAHFVPGRVEVLGKHTDYAGGRSLTAAVEQGFCTVSVPRTDQLVRVIASEARQSVDFQLEPSLSPAVGHWSNYPMTVARRIAQNFPGKLRGANIAFASDLPSAAGMSSSSALMIAIFKVLAEVNHLTHRDEYQRNIHNDFELAGYQATIENGRSFGELAGDRGVGTLGGSEDHLAILCSQAGQLRQYTYQPARAERSVAMPSGYLFAFASCGVVAEKTGEAMAKYNRASQLASHAAAVWRKASGRDDAHLSAAIHSSPQGISLLREVLRESQSPEFEATDTVERFEHFLAESEEIIPAVPETLEGPSLVRFGELVDRSQAIAESLLHNQIPETISLARSARDLGAAAASAFGAGYGGTVWALVKKSEAEQFLNRWRDSYRSKFPAVAKQAQFFRSHAGPSAVVI